MTKLLTVVIIVAVLFGVWELWVYYDKVAAQKEDEQKKAAAAVVTGDRLSGVPFQLDASLQTAQRKGVEGLKNWLDAYGSRIQDPRKAWIELDYCVLLAREDISEAKRIYREVRARTPTNSLVWPRIEQLAKTYQ